jgi:Family of unknown function (DUF5519)
LAGRRAICATDEPTRRTSASVGAKEQWRELREQGRIVEHPVFPEKVGPAARRIESDEDVRDVIELMRLNYERFSAAARAA